MINLIAAVGEDWSIGFCGRIPWHYKEDLKFFRRMTMGNSVIMGNKTYQSLPNKKLDGRHLFVLTIDVSQSSVEGVTFMHVGDLSWLNQLSGDVWIAGGADVYRQALTHKGLVDELYLTHIPHSYPEADTHFPDTLMRMNFGPMSEFEEVTSNGDTLRFCRYGRKG